MTFGPLYEHRFRMLPVQRKRIKLEETKADGPHTSQTNQCHNRSDMAAVDPIAEMNFTFSEGYYTMEGREVLDNKYVVQKFLGKGAFSTVWQTLDISRKRRVAIKIIRNAKWCDQSAIQEITIHKSIARIAASNSDGSTSPYVVQLLDNFKIPGGFTCLSTELLGQSLVALINHGHVSRRLVKSITRQVLQAVDFLHTKVNIIHADIKPENILICRRQTTAVLSGLAQLGMTEKMIGVKCARGMKRMDQFERGKSEQTIKKVKKASHSSVDNNYETIAANHLAPENKGKVEEFSGEKETQRMSNDIAVRIADFGNAFFTNEQYTNIIQTRPYRCPEAILLSEKTYLPCVDIWSIACLSYELWIDEYLMDIPFDVFKAENEGGVEVEKDIAHLIRISQLIGPIPTHMISRCQDELLSRREEFEGDGSGYTLSKDERLLRTVNGTSSDMRKEISEFTKFLKPMFEIDPIKRATAKECLKHPWLRVDC